MEFKRPHVINIFENTVRFWGLLIFPVIRGLLFSGQSFFDWIAGAWFDILIILGIIGLGFVGWYFNLYNIEEKGIYSQKGILLKKQRYIPYDVLSTVTLDTPFYLAPFKAVRVYIDTDAGNSNKADISITMNREDALKLKAKSRAAFVKNDKLRRIYRPKELYIAILSVLTSNTLTGVLFISAYISQSGKLLGSEFENDIVNTVMDISDILALGIPPVATAAAVVILVGWFISFVLNLLENKRFTVTRQGGNIEISKGIIIRRICSVSTKRVNMLEMRQSLITKLFGFYSVFVHSSGYGKRKREVSVLIPAADKFESGRNLGVLLPEIPVGKKQISPDKKSLPRFATKPLIIIFSILTAMIFALWLLSRFTKLILFVGIMSELPAVWFLIISIVSYFETGVGIQNGVYTLSCNYGFRFFKSAVPKKRITKIVLRQSIFQKPLKCCDAIIYVYSEGKNKIIVKNLPLESAKEMFKLK